MVRTRIGVRYSLSLPTLGLTRAIETRRINCIESNNTACWAVESCV